MSSAKLFVKLKVLKLANVDFAQTVYPWLRASSSTGPASTATMYSLPSCSNVRADISNNPQHLIHYPTSSKHGRTAILLGEEMGINGKSTARSFCALGIGSAIPRLGPL